MKRKSLLTILMTIVMGLISISSVFAQAGIRAEICAPVYQSTCIDPLQISETAGFGFQLGADYDIHVKNKFYLTPGIYWSYRTALSNSPTAEVSGSEFLQENFINIPVHAKWKFNIKPEKFGVYIFVGPTLSYALSSCSTIDLSVSGVSVDGKYDYLSGDCEFQFPGVDASTSAYLNNALQQEYDALGIRHNPFEARCDWGVGLVFKEIYELVLIGYDFGLNNKYKGSHADNYYFTCNNYYIGFRYRFGK